MNRIASAALLAAIFFVSPFVAHADFNISFEPTFQVKHAGISFYDGNPDNPDEPPPDIIVNASDFVRASNEWEFTQLTPRTDEQSNVPLERGIFIVARLNPETFDLEGGVPVRGQNYDFVHTAWSKTATETVQAALTLSPLGNSATPSGMYAVVFMELRGYVFLYDPDTGEETVLPLTEDYVGYALANDPYVYVPFDFSSRPIWFEYVNDLPPVDCCSSVLFLPGIMGSRLFENETKRWEPSGEADVLALYLNDEGESENLNIVAAEVIDEVPVTGGNIYKSFLIDLAAKKTEGAIADYVAYPYDWRLSIPDILADGSLEQTLRELAASSQTGKVAIVAHSNGGLVAKALVNALSDEAPELIDQLIFVGVPQIGTPKAIGALLHGFDAGIQFAVSPERVRDFARNAPMIYQLLPHIDYYNSAGAIIPFPIASFESGEASQMFLDVYGSLIGNGDELRDFVLGVEGRSNPAYADLKNPVIGNEMLYDNTALLMQSIGSSWTAPAGIVVHQIAGIGEDTLAGITYKTIQECTQVVGVGGGNIACLEYQPKLSYTPEEVVDGDGTVVAPSALAMSDSVENVSRWWLNTDDYNEIERPFADLPLLSFLRTNHKDLLEIDELRSFIFTNLLTESFEVLPNYVSEIQPVIESENRLRFVLHSPLTLTAIANDVEYPAKRYGEVQVVSVPADKSPVLTLQGINDGSFTLEVEEYVSDTLVATTTFTGIPSSAGTIATMNFTDGTIQNAGNLEVDYDGNGEIDLMLAPEEGEIILPPEPSLADLLGILKATVHDLQIKEKLKKNLLKQIDKLEKKIEKKKKKNAKILAKLEKKITKQEAKGKLNTSDAEELLALIEELEAQAEDVALDLELLAALKEKIESLDIKKGLKDNLLKRVEKLEDTQALVKTLNRLSAKILKKGEKGDIDEAGVEELLELLDKIEDMI